MSYSQYFPLDEVLVRPRIKALRALRFFDWCSYGDLLIACEVTDDPTAQNTFCQGIRQAIRRGEIKKTGTQRGVRYRITNKGRAEIAGLRADYTRALERAA